MSLRGLTGEHPAVSTQDRIPSPAKDICCRGTLRPDRASYQETGLGHQEPVFDNLALKHPKAMMKVDLI